MLFSPQVGLQGAGKRSILFKMRHVDIVTPPGGVWPEPACEACTTHVPLCRHFCRMRRSYAVLESLYCCRSLTPVLGVPGQSQVPHVHSSETIQSAECVRRFRHVQPACFLSARCNLLSLPHVHQKPRPCVQLWTYNNISPCAVPSFWDSVLFNGHS